MSKPKLTVFSLLCHVYQLFSADPTFELLYHLEYIPLDPTAALAAYILQKSPQLFSCQVVYYA